MLQHKNPLNFWTAKGTVNVIILGLTFNIKKSNKLQLKGIFNLSSATWACTETGTQLILIFITNSQTIAADLLKSLGD